MKNLIILAGLMFIVSCASDGGQSMSHNDTYTMDGSSQLYEGSHIIDRLSSPFVGGGFNRFTE